MIGNCDVAINIYTFVCVIAFNFTNMFLEWKLMNAFMNGLQ